MPCCVVYVLHLVSGKLILLRLVVFISELLNGNCHNPPPSILWVFLASINYQKVPPYIFNCLNKCADLK